MNRWECICGEVHGSREAWSQCYRSHPRRGQFVVLTGRRIAQGAAPLWDHPDGRRRNYPPPDPPPQIQAEIHRAPASAGALLVSGTVEVLPDFCC